MKKILLPTDFSENAYNAIKYAVQLFKYEECTFYLLNTYTPILYDSDYILYNSPKLSLEEIYRENSKRGLEKVIDRITREFPNARHIFDKVSAFNMLNEEIREQVKNKDIDLVVMGTQGATGAAQVIFGTHTVHAIKRAICPLLAIPSFYEFRLPENILFPTDYEINYTQKHLNLLRDIAEGNAAKIHILNVHFGFPLERNQERAKKILAEYFNEINHRFNSVEKDTVTAGIYHFQSEHSIDMLAMISNKHSFFENLLFRPVINEIGFQIKIPFLVIPSGKYNT